MHTFSLILLFSSFSYLYLFIQGCADRCAEAERQRRARALLLQLTWSFVHLKVWNKCFYDKMLEETFWWMFMLTYILCIESEHYYFNSVDLCTLANCLTFIENSSWPISCVFKIGVEESNILRAVTSSDDKWRRRGSIFWDMGRFPLLPMATQTKTVSDHPLTNLEFKLNSWSTLNQPPAKLASEIWLENEGRVSEDLQPLRGDGEGWPGSDSHLHVEGRQVHCQAAAWIFNTTSNTTFTSTTFVPHQLRPLPLRRLW